MAFMSLGKVLCRRIEVMTTGSDGKRRELELLPRKCRGPPDPEAQLDRSKIFCGNSSKRLGMRYGAMTPHVDMALLQRRNPDDGPKTPIFEINTLMSEKYVERGSPFIPTPAISTVLQAHEHRLDCAAVLLLRDDWNLTSVAFRTSCKRHSGYRARGIQDIAQQFAAVFAPGLKKGTTPWRLSSVRKRRQGHVLDKFNRKATMALMNSTGKRQTSA
ncbi:hypothetical protein C8J56DRAFT_889518 [Mycena floridula]|nr:hypothetical protein C8J56DRAFT_889518 [Mycena floridula]